MVSDQLSQIVGVAYTYAPSVAARQRLTVGTDRGHSAHTKDFSFFVKCPPSEAAGHDEPLRLRRHPVTGAAVPHWPEAEVAVLLGSRHRFVAYTLANDLTAFTVETAAPDPSGDRTYFGKCWPGSCSLGPAFVAVPGLGDGRDVDVGLRIERDGQVILDARYSTASRRHEFRDIPDLVVERRRGLGDAPPLSKRVGLGPDGYLLPGTVLLLGTGIIVPEAAYCRDGDRIAVSCAELGRLSNVVTAAAA